MTLPILLRNLSSALRYARRQREQQQSQRRSDVDRESVRNGERAVAEAAAREGQAQ